MTPTSATGRAEARSGFTLVELMMTIAIIGVAAGAVVLSMPDPNPSISEAAERFAARLSRAREEAVLANQPVAVQADRAGYAFSRFDGVRWSPLTEGPFGPETWGEGVTVRMNRPIRVVFDTTGAADPVSVVLSRDSRTRTVTVDGAGEVRLDG